MYSKIKCILTLSMVKNIIAYCYIIVRIPLFDVKNDELKMKKILRLLDFVILYIPFYQWLKFGKRIRDISISYSQ